MHHSQTYTAPTLNKTAHTVYHRQPVRTYVCIHIRVPKWQNGCMYIACVRALGPWDAGIIIFIVIMAMNIIRFTSGHGCSYRLSTWALRETEREDMTSTSPIVMCVPNWYRETGA